MTFWLVASWPCCGSKGCMYPAVTEFLDDSYKIIFSGNVKEGKCMLNENVSEIDFRLSVVVGMEIYVKEYKLYPYNY